MTSALTELNICEIFVIFTFVEAVYSTIYFLIFCPVEANKFISKL